MKKYQAPIAEVVTLELDERIASDNEEGDIKPGLGSNILE